MPMRLYNTLSGEVETFLPIDPARVTFYSCGPTVYDFAHIGNFRAFLCADVLRRWIESPLCTIGDGEGTPGPRSVRQVMNMTDVGHMVDDDLADGGGEDKMEAAAKRLAEAKKSGKLPAGANVDPANPYAIADFYASAFLEDARLVGLKVVADADEAVKRAGNNEQARDEFMPRPTRMVREQLELVMTLLKKGCAYVAADGVCYFDTQKFTDYGQLSGNTLDKIRSGAGGRVAAATQSVKKHPADFMLWKPDPSHLMRWDPKKILNDPSCPLGEGYPGWHLECSAMARARLGDEIDLHSGGEDNIFPHHECEIAQSRCATGKPFFARYWFHARFLMVEGEKMSKSKGNFFTVRELVAKGFDPAAIRLELIKTHYRSNANFTEQGLKDSARMVDRWREFLSRAESGGDTPGAAGLSEQAKQSSAAFADSMSEDVNVAGAIGAINTWINRTEKPSKGDAGLMRTFDAVLGVLSLPKPNALASGNASARSEEDARIDDLVRRRTEARQTKNWAEADKIRDELNALKIVVEDTPSGPKWSRKVGL
ncbi:MAG TPA: cysteine--tRNA ligase [Phycisphaerales bacterium]|nr:cysteine--tRNA ligase [Phycisphaerales bacterium]